MANEKNPNVDSVQIDWAKLDAITVYQITEDELTMIQSGGPSSNYLNFAIALLSIFIAFLITLLTTKIEDDRTYMFFLLTAIVTAVVGVILLIIWFISNRSASNVFMKIRARKNSNEVRRAIDDTAEAKSEHNPT